MGKKMAILAAVAAIAGFLLDYAASNFAEAIKNPLFDHVMQWFSSAVTITIVLVVMTSLFFWEEKKKKWVKVLLMSFASSLIVSTALKLIFARPRPIPYEGFLFSVYSFPSTHAAIAFALLPVLGREFPKLKWFWMAFAFAIAASRVYLGLHYFSDVVAGAVIGYCIGQFFVWRQGKRKQESKWGLK
jgi:undecaprenyl-diphosphatase